MPILNYTTKISCHKTLSEISQILGKHGATKTVIDNDGNGNPVAMTFCINWRGCIVGFMLPCNFEGVKKAMIKGKVARSLCTDEQALRVGWRIMKDWVEAQMAIVEAGLAVMAEVFLPYAITKNGTTLYNEIQYLDTLLLN